MSWMQDASTPGSLKASVVTTMLVCMASLVWLFRTRRANEISSASEPQAITTYESASFREWAENTSKEVEALADLVIRSTAADGALFVIRCHGHAPDLLGQTGLHPGRLGEAGTAAY